MSAGVRFRLLFALLGLLFFSCEAQTSSSKTSSGIDQDDCFYDFWFEDEQSVKVWCSSNSEGPWTLYERASQTKFKSIKKVLEPSILIGWHEVGGSVRTVFFAYEQDLIVAYDSDGSAMFSTTAPSSFKKLDRSAHPATMRFGPFSRLARNPYQDCVAGLSVNVTERMIRAMFVDLDGLEKGFENAVTQEIFFVDESLNLTPYVEERKAVCYADAGRKRIAFTVNGQVNSDGRYARQGGVLVADFQSGQVEEVYRSPEQFPNDSLRLSPVPDGVIIESVRADLYILFDPTDWSRKATFKAGNSNGFLQASNDLNSILVLTLRDYSNEPQLGYSIIEQCTQSEHGCLKRVLLPEDLSHYNFADQFWLERFNFIAEDDSGTLFVLNENEISVENGH